MGAGIGHRPGLPQNPDITPPGPECVGASHHQCYGYSAQGAEAQQAQGCRTSAWGGVWPGPGGGPGLCLQSRDGDRHTHLLWCGRDDQGSWQGPGCSVNSRPAPCPTDSTLKPSNMASFSGPALGVHPAAGTLGLQPLGSDAAGASPSAHPRPSPQPPKTQWLLGMSSPGLRDLKASGTAQGSLCLPAGGWVQEQMPGVQPLPAPRHPVQSWVCSLHTSPLPP